MNYRKMGKYGIKISEVSLGSWQTFGSAKDIEITNQCVKKAYELGINHFDTANVYGYGQTHAGAAEESLAEALSDFTRSSYVLATKAFWPVGEGVNDRGLSRKHIFEQCELSLKRLKTDYVDIFYCHRYDTETPLEETLMALDDLVRQGKILYIGVSEWTASQISDATHITKSMNLNPIAISQPCYNMLKRDIEKEVLPLCGVEGIGTAVWSPIAQGVLTGKYKFGEKYPADSRANDPMAYNGLMDEYLTDKNLEKVQKLKKISDELGISLVQLALSWILFKKEITSVIIGASRPDQITENIKSIDIKLDLSIISKINKILEE